MGKSFDDAQRAAFVAGAMSMIGKPDKEDKEFIEDNFQEWKRAEQRKSFRQITGSNDDVDGLNEYEKGMGL